MLISRACDHETKGTFRILKVLNDIYSCPYLFIIIIIISAHRRLLLDMTSPKDSYNDRSCAARLHQFLVTFTRSLVHLV